MAFAHDVFISYAHGDRDWAAKLDQLLRKTGDGYTTFFDQQSLRAGDDWELKIQAALEDARHFILVWSDQAKDSDWVSHERVSFLLNAKPKVNKDRRIICINLQGMNQTTKAFQQISRSAFQGAYPDVTKIAAAEWDQVIEEIVDGLNPEKRPLSVPIVVLTLDAKALDTITQEQWAWLKDDFALEEKDLRTRYGATRADWRPFASEESITAVLEKVRTSINGALKDFRLDWNLPEAAFWTDPLEAKAFVTKEFRPGPLSVLIVDPVAILNRDIFQRLMLFRDSFGSERTAIVMLPPFAIPSHVLRLRSALLKFGTPYFDDYFQPPVPPTQRILAQCSWNVSDRDEVQRQILAAAGSLAMQDDPAQSSTFLRQGARR